MRSVRFIHSFIHGEIGEVHSFIHGEMGEVHSFAPLGSSPTIRCWS